MQYQIRKKGEEQRPFIMRGCQLKVSQLMNRRAIWLQLRDKGEFVEKYPPEPTRGVGSV
jgi:hypothetical protein